MNFLVSAITWLAKSSLGQFVINLVFGKLTDFIKGIIEKNKRQEELKKAAEQSVLDLKKAKTAKEIDDATDKVLDNF